MVSCNHRSALQRRAVRGKDRGMIRNCGYAMTRTRMRSNHSRNRRYLLASTMALVLAGVWFGLYLAPANQPIGYRAALSCTLYLLLYSVLIGLYRARWEALSPGSWVLRALAIGFGPFIILQIATRFHADQFVRDPASMAFGLLAWITLADPWSFSSQALNQLMPINARESSMYLTYPPARRLDMLSIDVLVITLFILATLRALRWH